MIKQARHGSSDKLKKAKKLADPSPKETKKTLTTPYFAIGSLPKSWRVNNLLNF